MSHRWRANGEAHAFENLARIDRRMDRSKNLQTSVTIRTLQNVEFKNAFPYKFVTGRAGPATDETGVG